MRKWISILSVLSFLILPQFLEAKAKRKAKVRTTVQKAIVIKKSVKQAAVCTQRSNIEPKIKKQFNLLWENVDSSVGVEFFMLVLKSNDRMPASELSTADYYNKLLKGMKRTSLELADHGVKFDSKKIKGLEDLIQKLGQQEDCRQVVTR